VLTSEEVFIPAFRRRLARIDETGSFSSGKTVNKYRNTQMREIRKLGEREATTKKEDAFI